MTLTEGVKMSMTLTEGVMISMTLTEGVKMSMTLTEGVTIAIMTLTGEARCFFFFFFFQSPHCPANCLQHVRSSSQGVCQPHAAHQTRSTSNMLCAAWFQGSVQLLSLTELTSHFTYIFVAVLIHRFLNKSCASTTTTTKINTETKEKNERERERKKKESLNET